MTQTKRSGPACQEGAAANALVDSQHSAEGRQFPWPDTKPIGSASVEYVGWLRRASHCVPCDAWRGGQHPEHLVPDDALVESLAARGRRLADQRAVRDELAERRQYGLRARHAAKLRR